MSAEHSRGLVDTDIIILHRWLDPAELPDEIAISSVTLAELSVGPHAVVGDTAEARTERARRVAVLQRTEHEFDPIPFDDHAARVYGQLSGALIRRGRRPRRRVADLQIAATAAAAGLPLYTTNPDDYVGLDEWLMVVPVTRPVDAR